VQRGTGEGGGEEATEVECAGQRILAGGGGAPEAVCRAAGGVARWRATTEEATWGVACGSGGGVPYDLWEVAPGRDGGHIGQQNLIICIRNAQMSNESLLMIFDPILEKPRCRVLFWRSRSTRIS
jgi:hypothetical protein